MTTHTEPHDTQHPLLVRDLVVGAVTVVLTGALLLGLALVIKGAVEVLGMVALAG